MALKLLTPGDEVDYTIGFKNKYDNYYAGGFQDVGSTSAGHCGTPKQRSGLMAQFLETDLVKIPYNKLVEVSMAVFNGGGFGAGSLTLCNDFVDVEILLSCSCEIPSSSGLVYQYGVVQDPVSKLVSISYDPINRIYPANSTATFSVSWPASPPARRSLLNVTNDHGRKVTWTDGSIEGLNSMMEAKMDTHSSELNNHFSAFNTSVESKIKVLESKVGSLEASISDIHETVGFKLNRLARDMDMKMETLGKNTGGKIDDLTASFLAFEQKLLESTQSPSTNMIDEYFSLFWVSLFLICCLCVNCVMWWVTKKNVNDGRGEKSAV